ncbi:MAG: phenylalanine--tRNA ligase subunit beta [bacterium]
MLISYKWFQTFFKEKLPSPEEVSKKLESLAFEVEGIEKVGASDVLDVKILPDRAHYCLSHRGIAEEIHGITGQALKVPRDIPVAPTANPQILAPKITFVTSHAELDARGLFCRRYMGRRVENISVAESPDWMKAHLKEIGERSINNIVDSTNIIMFDCGQPLHAFDADQISGDLVVRAAKEGEKIVLLDAKPEGKEVTLKATDHVIADEVGPLAIAGVKGGKRAQVTATTKNIVIESANFDPTAVRRTATRLNLRNESSRRFENEITPELAADGMELVSGLIGSLVPAAATSMSEVVDIYPARPEPTVITISRDYVNTRLGTVVPAAIFDEILSRLGIVAIQSPNKSGEFSLTIPYHRLDLNIAEDLVEEIGRVYGYEKITTHLPAPQEKRITVFPAFYIAEKIKNILVLAGFSEVNLYTLVAKGVVETAHPLADDKAFARENLTDGVMVCLQKNALNADLLGLDTVKIFEIGHTFTAGGESTKLAIGIAQVKKIKGVKSDALVNTAIEFLAKELNISIPSPALISKGIHSVVEIDLDTAAQAYKLSSTATYADLGFGKAASVMYKKFSVYPFMVRDIAVFTPEHITDADVWAAIYKGILAVHSDNLLVRHALFDTFKKDGKISYAFRMVFQSMEKTLTDDEVNTVMQSVYAQVKERNWEVR